jgi:hypothetical protein
MLPRRLFKYLPEQYVSDVLNGDILFRNLVYFKRIEHDPRINVYEGLHSSETDSDYDLITYKKGVFPLEQDSVYKGRWPIQYVLTNPDKIFCFCVSARMDVELAKFGGSCIEIHEPDELRRRIERRLKRLSQLHQFETPVLLSGPVTYYHAKGAIPDGVDRDNPRHLPFVKREQYASEEEVRFVFAKKNGYKLQTRLISLNYNYNDDIKDKKNDQMLIRLGSIRDITRCVNL